MTGIREQRRRLLPTRLMHAVADARGVTLVQQNVAALDVTLTADQLAVLDPVASQVTGTRY